MKKWYVSFVGSLVFALTALLIESIDFKVLTVHIAMAAAASILLTICILSAAKIAIGSRIW